MRRSRASRVWAGAAAGAAPLLRLWLGRRAARGKEISARLGERFGVETMARPAGRVIWLHAASVGEAVSVLPVLAALPADVFTVFTTGTLTSARLLAQRLPEMGLSARVAHRFVPLDVPAWGGRFLDHWRPEVACFLESELWPNLLAACQARGVRLALVNGRMSVRSASRWANLPGFAAEVIGAFDWIEAQSDGDARRLASLGGRDVRCSGNLKFAADVLPVDSGELARLAAALGDRPRWAAASTHPGDEALVAGVHAVLAARFPGLVTAIVPRHPERGAAIAATLGGAARRGLGEDPPAGGGIWLADTLGELGLIYRAFATVFMGKSFGAGGGQNPLEPARLGCAVATGPSVANFADVVTVLREAEGLAVVADAVTLTAWVAAMLADPAARAAMGARAADAAQAADALPGMLAARLVAVGQQEAGGPRRSPDPPAVFGGISV